MTPEEQAQLPTHPIEPATLAWLKEHDPEALDLLCAAHEGGITIFSRLPEGTMFNFVDRLLRHTAIKNTATTAADCGGGRVPNPSYTVHPRKPVMPIKWDRFPSTPAQPTSTP